MTYTTLMDVVDEARSIVASALDEDVTALEPRDVGHLRNAAAVLAAEVKRLTAVTQRLEARLQSAPGTTTLATASGACLERRMDTGGWRHYLNGWPVHAGASLYLLTALGWMPGRYEWSFRADRAPTFHTALPGAGQIAIALPSDAHLAWPDAMQ